MRLRIEGPPPRFTPARFFGSPLFAFVPGPNPFECVSKNWSCLQASVEDQIAFSACSDLYWREPDSGSLQYGFRFLLKTGFR